MEFAEDFFNNLPDFMNKKEFTKMQSEKAKIISLLAKNLYVVCTLSREQMKNITTFWKSMFSFLIPEATPFVQKIHVSYTRCVREAQKQYDAIQAKHLEMFRDCCFFSLAVDTAPFGRDHFLSCIGRFVYEDRISQVVLIFDRVEEKTGEKLARFIFDKLNEKIATSQSLSQLLPMGRKI